jgi:hypothetical protein
MQLRDAIGNKGRLPGAAGGSECSIGGCYCDQCDAAVVTNQIAIRKKRASLLAKMATGGVSLTMFGRARFERYRNHARQPRLPEVLLKEGKRPLSEVEPGFDPEPIHLCCRRRPNAVELLDRQSFDEGRPHLRCNDEEVTC